MQPQRQAEPLTGPLLRQVLGGFGNNPLDLRDAALLSLLYTFALRSAELTNLDWARLGSGRGFLKITTDRAELTMFGSKAAQKTPELVAVPIAAIPLAVEAVRTWVQHADLSQGEPLVCPLTRSGGVRRERLHVASIGAIVKRAMARHFRRSLIAPGEALARASCFSGHSGRIGLYVTASEAGAPLQHTAAVARHKSLAMALQYGRKADMLKCAPHWLPQVGV